MTKRLGGIDWMQNHSAVYEKAEHSWSEKWNAKERTLVVLKRWPFIQAIYVCFVILETLLLRKWTPKLAGYRGQFLNCFILIPSRAGVCGKLLYWYGSICLRYLKIFAIIQFESFQLDIIKLEIFFFCYPGYFSLENWYLRRFSVVIYAISSTNLSGLYCTESNFNFM